MTSEHRLRALRSWLAGVVWAEVPAHVRAEVLGLVNAYVVFGEYADLAKVPWARLHLELLESVWLEMSQACRRNGRCFCGRNHANPEYPAA